MEIHNEIKIDFELTNKLKRTIEKLERVFWVAQHYDEESKEYSKLDGKFLILCDDLEIDAKMGERAGYITWEQVDLLMAKYRF